VNSDTTTLVHHPETQEPRTQMAISRIRHALRHSSLALRHCDGTVQYRLKLAVRMEYSNTYRSVCFFANPKTPPWHLI